MKNLVDMVISGNDVKSNRGFIVSKPGLMLLKSGAENLDDVLKKLENLFPHAEEACTPAAFTSQFPGIGYIIHYFLKWGVKPRSQDAVEILNRLPPILLAETMNVAARLSGQKTPDLEFTGASMEPLISIARGVEHGDRYLKLAAQRLLGAYEEKS